MDFDPLLIPLYLGFEISNNPKDMKTPSTDFVAWTSQYTIMIIFVDNAIAIFKYKNSRCTVFDILILTKISHNNSLLCQYYKIPSLTCIELQGFQINLSKDQHIHITP